MRLTSIAVTLALLPQLWGQCWGQGSAGQFVPAVPLFAPLQIQEDSPPRWTLTPSGENYALIRDGVQLGAWSPARSQYCPYDALTRTWGEWTDEAPITPPAVQGVQAEAEQETPDEPKDKDKPPVKDEPKPEDKPKENFGIDLDKMREDTAPIYRLDGERVPRQVAEAALDKIPEDRTLDRLTIFGPKEQRLKMREMLETDPALVKEFRSKLVVQDYPIDHWIVSARRFAVEPATLTTYYQSADGTVLDRWTGLEPPEKLLDRLRRRGKPKREPLLPKLVPSLIPLLGALGVPWSVWVFGGLALAGIVWKRRKGVT